MKSLYNKLIDYEQCTLTSGIPAFILLAKRVCFDPDGMYLMRYQDVTNALIRDGYYELPEFFDAGDTRALLDAVMKNRRFDQSIFITEEEWEASSKSHKRTSPGPGYNALEEVAEKLTFIEKNKELNNFFEHLLGKGYRVLSKRLVCRLPWSSVPIWLRKRREGKVNNSFGAFVYPPHRTMTYYLDVDLHQDIQDWVRLPTDQKEHRCLTFYVYLDDVTVDDAPLQLLPGSHLFGATPFQHDVNYLPESNEWIYRDLKGNSLTTPMKTLTGKAGYGGIWHSCMLHGTPPVREGHFRMSLRYLVAHAPSSATAAIDEINQHVRGPLYLEKDYTPGSNAGTDGFWNLRLTDYVQASYQQMGLGDPFSE